jgi:TIGR03009 family protein
MQQTPPAYPDQPIEPQDPRLRRRSAEEMQRAPQPQAGSPNAAPGMAPANPGPPQPPFDLTPAERQQLDRVLLFWEKSSTGVKSFRANFRRWDYNPALADPQKQDPNQPISQDDGELRFQTPDKGLFSIEKGPRAEKWICDGKSMFQYDFRTHKVHEYRLPPEAQGRGITNGPMPFLFGAKAEQLKRRYWVRIVTPPEAKDQIWLEAQPKFLVDAQDFRKVEIILSIGREDLMPTAIQIYLPGPPDSKVRTVYTLSNIKINQMDPRGIFQDPFTARVPSGWQKIIEEAALAPNAAQPGPARAADNWFACWLQDGLPIRPTVVRPHTVGNALCGVPGIVADAVCGSPERHRGRSLPTHHAGQAQGHRHLARWRSPLPPPAATRS